MGLLNRLFGSEPQHDPPRGTVTPNQDAHALERYRYMLQTAPPETIEQAHAEAFEKLTPEQRREVLRELARAAPGHERAAIERVSADDSRGLARAATRAELRTPGIMERTLGASPALGFGAGLLGSFAAAFAGSMVATTFFSALGGFDGGAAIDGAGADDEALGALGDQSAELDGAGDFDGADFDL